MPLLLPRHAGWRLLQVFGRRRNLTETAAASGKHPLRWVLPTVGSLVTLAAFVGTLGPIAAKLFAGDGDVGRHIRLGTYILESRSIPREDLFSFTMAGEAFVPYEWLSEVAFAGSHMLFGLAGVALLSAILFAGTSALVYWMTVRMGVGRPLAALVTVYSIVLQSSHLLPRPHLFTTLLTAATLALLLEYRRSGNRRWLWTLPPLFVVWANLHGGFLIGFMLIGAFGAEAIWRAMTGGAAGGTVKVRDLAVAGVLCVAATLVNPVGLAILPHTTGYIGEQFLVDVTHEYMSPDFHGLAGKLFLYNLLAGILLFMSGRARPSFVGGFLFLLWTSAALYSSRNIPIFSVVLTPFIGLWLERVLSSVADSENWGSVRAEKYRAWSERMSRQDAALTQPLGLILVLVATAAFFVSPARRDRYAWDPEVFPVQAVPWAQEAGLHGNVFNQFTWGGYLLYAAPEIPVFIDGQTDFYGETLTREYLTVLDAHPGWDSVLVAHDIDWTITENKQQLNQVLALRSDWERVYEDGTATIFVRSED